MPTKSSAPVFAEKEAEHVLITEYLTGTNKISNESKIDEYNVIAVSPNDHRWYRSVIIKEKIGEKRKFFLD